MKISASMVFDCSYIEPAFVTAYELCQRENLFKSLTLFYVSRGDARDVEARDMLARFCASFSGRCAVNAIEISDSLPGFQAFHFNNSIIYKGLIPSLLPHEQFVLNVDAGVHLGAGFDLYVESIIDGLCLENAEWVIGAHCSSARENLSEVQLGFDYNELYPRGVMLLFNSKRYAEVGWYDRYVSAYQHWAGQLRYAEQELICLVGKGAEIADLPGWGGVAIHQLGVDVLCDRASKLDEADLVDCAFFKFSGSFKPWKYWVLDPNKDLYLRRRMKLELNFPISGMRIVEDARVECARPDWALGFYKAYESHLVRASL